LNPFRLFHVKRSGVRRHLAIGAIVLVLATLSAPATGERATASSSPRATAVPHSTNYVPGVLLISRRAGVSPSAVTQVAPRASVLRSIGRSGVEKWQVARGSEVAIATQLLMSGLVDFAEPDYILHTTVTPNDPLFSQQWALPRINAPAAWGTTDGFSTVTVAVIDTGFDLTHPDRPINLIPGPTYTSTASLDGCLPEGVNGPVDDFGHGTHVGGIVAAAINNGIGIAGLAPGVTLLVIKAGDCQGSLADSDVADAIDYATSAGARVINMSFGGIDWSDAVNLSVQNASNAGVVLVAAAGNDASSEQFYPADLPNVVAVVATDANDDVTWFSNRGPDVDLAAPGYLILSTVPMGTPLNPGTALYANLSGTSMASPYVAAAAALLLSAACGLTNDAAVSALERTAVSLRSPIPNPTSGYGRIDTAAALQAVLGTSPQTPVPTPPGLSRMALLPIVPFQRC
jgi:subtilisin family serine protease